MRIDYSYRGKERTFDTEKTEVIIGRPKEGAVVDLDLTPDRSVSRLHTRIWIEEGECWIQDLNSKRGTQVNGQEIKNQGKRRLQPGDTIRIGGTTLRVEMTEPEEPTESLDASALAFDSTEPAITEADRRLALFYELPLTFGAETKLETLLQTIIEQLVKAEIKVIPHAMRGALLVKDRATGQLLLKAHWPVGDPAVSMSLAQQAMEQRKAVVWPSSIPSAESSDNQTQPKPKSVDQYHIQSAMYAPLLWKDEVLGVVCVDNDQTSPTFSLDDLRLLQAVAHHAAMAVANLQLQEDLRRQLEFINRLFSSRFPPRIREKLLQEASAGTLPIGTRRSPITALISDIRGFTKLTEQLGPQRMSDLLNEYFPPLIEAIFEYEGTIERFVGDAIFAVFGSPEPDALQHEHAVQAALKMQEEVTRLNATRAARGAATCAIGIGVDCGEALHGFIGNAERIEFAVIGDAANRASRYCNGAGFGEVLISPELYQRVFRIVEVEQTTIPTKHEGTFEAYRVKRIK